MNFENVRVMNKRKKPKTTLKQVIQIAKQTGAEVKIDLKPKETSTEPILLMVETLKAIYHLAETRKLDALESARLLLRRISTNEIQFILMRLQQDEHAKPVLERNY